MTEMVWSMFIRGYYDIISFVSSCKQLKQIIIYSDYEKNSHKKLANRPLDRLKLFIHSPRSIFIQNLWIWKNVRKRINVTLLSFNCKAMRALKRRKIPPKEHLCDHEVKAFA